MKVLLALLSLVTTHANLLVIWDRSNFASNANTTISLKYYKATLPGEIPLPLINTTNTGSAIINMTAAFAPGALNASMRLTLKTVDSSGDVKSFYGPIFTLASNDTTSSHSTLSDNAKKLGEKVGLPLGLIFFFVLLGAIAVFLFLKKRRGQGYLTRQSRSQRTGRAAVIDATGHRRTESFHDEPTTGVELQDRGRKAQGEDNWDWGSEVGSPVRGSSGNAFREELGRQRGGR